MGQDVKTVFINGLLDVKIFGTRGESVRFRIRRSNNKTTAATAKTTRFAILLRSLRECGKTSGNMRLVMLLR